MNERTTLWVEQVLCVYSGTPQPVTINGRVIQVRPRRVSKNLQNYLILNGANVWSENSSPYTPQFIKHLRAAKRPSGFGLRATNIKAYETRL